MEDKFKTLVESLIKVFEENEAGVVSIKMKHNDKYWVRVSISDDESELED